MKSIRSVSIVVLLLITSIVPTRADWFQDNRVRVTAALAVTAVAGCVGLGVKLYFDWKKRSAKKSYKFAIKIMEDVIVDPLSNNLAIDGGPITQAHLYHFQPRMHGDLANIFIDGIETIDLKNARAKNGAKYFPELEQKASELYPLFKEASAKFKKTVNLLSSFDSLTSMLSATVHRLNCEINYSQQLQQVQSPIDSFVSNSAWWLVDAHKTVLGHYTQLTNDLALAERTLASIETYNHQINYVRNYSGLLKQARRAQIYLGSLLHNIRSHSSYDRQVELFEQHKRHQEELARQQRREEELRREISRLCSDMSRLQSAQSQTTIVNQQQHVNVAQQAPARDNAREQQLQTDLDRTREELNTMRDKLDTFRREARAEGLIN